MPGCIIVIVVTKYNCLGSAAAVPKASSCGYESCLSNRYTGAQALGAIASHPAARAFYLRHLTQQSRTCMNGFIRLALQASPIFGRWLQRGGCDLAGRYVLGPPELSSRDMIRRAGVHLK